MTRSISILLLPTTSRISIKFGIARFGLHQTFSGESELDFCHAKQTLFLACNLWVVPRRVVFNNRRFGTMCVFHLHRRVDMKMEQTQCSETSQIIHHTPGNNPKDYTQNLEHGESLKSRNPISFLLQTDVRGLYKRKQPNKSADLLFPPMSPHVPYVLRGLPVLAEM
jgi:hypothetical protein